MEFISNNLENIWLVLTSVVTLAVAITALTPSPKDDGIARKVRDVLDTLAGNFGSAKNDPNNE